MFIKSKIKTNQICALFLATFISGCANVSPSAPKNTLLTKQSKTQATTSLEKDKIQNWGSKTFHGKTGDRLDAKETALLNLLQGYIGKRDGGDCSGFVTLVNKKLNRDFFDEKELDKFYTKHGLKSEAMFKLYESKNLIAFDDPKVGDLVFFNNTTRSTKNNKKAKIITHVGIVSSVEKDGTVGFTHNSRGKNAVDFMNLKNKNTRKKGNKELNSYVVSCKNNNTSCLASNRFAGFGKASVRRN
ncbi:NlpC/P60 family protein [uncultured Campylobacter sp.]|uniref:NlpC/P60 family protein n=1 Tax=uncultured Campylobacter sp. TaxID=218934 RepID=UPI0026375977|nr:NlpC/P60 family protein [uncultured Campylobacter sp.]